MQERRERRAKKLLGIKHDQGKAPISLVPSGALKATARVLAFGAKKYGVHNWRGGMEHSRLSSAALRHIFSYTDGQNLDPESGEEHLAHAICCLMMLLEFRIDRKGDDDRYKKED